MIGRIEGRLLEKNPPGILVDANGVGYEIDVPMSTFYQLPSISERVTLLTHLIVREDAHQLYGFSTNSERAAFRELIKISGVGARTALSVLSGLSVSELAQTITLAGKRTLDACAGYRQENGRASVAGVKRQARCRSRHSEDDCGE